MAVIESVGQSLLEEKPSRLLSATLNNSCYSPINYLTFIVNLRVLIYLNPLVVDKIAKKFIYDKDSGFLYTKQLINQLPKDWRYNILVPKGVPAEFFGADRVINLIEYDYSTSIHQNRYHFNRNILAKNFPYTTDIDVVINHQPEVSANLRSFFENQRREKPLILSFYHWIDCKESRTYAEELGGYFWRQLDGAIASDLNYFHSAHAWDLFSGEAKEHLKKIPKLNCRYFRPEPTIFGAEPFELPDKKIILFNHRCNNSTGWKEVLEICTRIRKKRDDFVLWFTDDQKLDSKKALENVDFVIQQRVPFKNYGYLLQNSHFAICNTWGYATWNMAVIDAIANGCLAVVPNNRLYNSMIHSAVSFYKEQLEVMLIELLDIDKNFIKSRHAGVGIRNNENTIQKDIMDLIDKRSETNPAKYDDVLRFVGEQKVCKKGDWVNKFWSFHVNSNFQKIRWKLLNVFSDDIAEEKTTYVSHV